MASGHSCHSTSHQSLNSNSSLSNSSLVSGPFSTDHQAKRSNQNTYGQLLIPDSLYIGLYCHDESPHRPNDFHWTLYHHLDANTGGTNYQIFYLKTAGHYVPSHTFTTNITKETLLLGLLRVAWVPDELKQVMDDIARSSDETLLNSADGSRMECRSWALDVLQLLANQDSIGKTNVMSCLNVGELEQEALEFGAEFREVACKNEEARPVRDSRSVTDI